MARQNFHYAITLAQMLYDVEGDTEDLEEIGLVAWNFIGNKNTRLYKASITIDLETGRGLLPCNCDGNYIEVMTYCGPEDWSYTSNIHLYGDIKSSYIEDHIEIQKRFLDPIYQSGKMVKYRLEGDYIYVNKGIPRVNILYHGLEMDEEGLPEINDKEAIAIAEYIAYTLKFKEAIKTNNLNLMTMAKELKLQWLIHCDAARVPEFINQNEMNMILDAQTSWNRKIHNFSYKPTV